LSDIDSEAKEIEFWDWKDMADKDFVAAEEALAKPKKCDKGTKACEAEKKKAKANKFLDELEHPAKAKEAAEKRKEKANQIMDEIEHKGGKRA